MIVKDEDNSAEPGNKRSRCRVNRQLLPLKMFYFFFYGASGTFIPFITVYLKHLRMSAAEAGLITGLSMLVAMVMRAAIGMVADKTSARKTALLICCLGFGSAFFAMWFVPRRDVPGDYSTNSTVDGPEFSSLNNQHQLRYDWTCWTNDGQEICRYPASVGHTSCRIDESSTTGWDLGYQRFPAVGDGDYISEYTNNAKDETVNAKDTPSSDVRDEEGGNLLSRRHFHETSPCFYFTANTGKSNTVGTGRHSLSTEHAEQDTIQSAEFLDSSVTASSSAGKYHNTNRMSTQINAVTNDVVSCLLNCTRRLVNGSDDEASDVMLKHPISEPTVFKLGRGQSVSTDLTFALSFLLLITGKSLYSASTSLADAVTYTILGPYSLKWGQQRLWGTVGTGLTVLSITLVNDRRQVESFTGLFVACFGLSVLAFLIGFFKLRADRAPKNKIFFKDLSKLLGSGAVRLFLAKLLFYGVMAGTVQNFTFWFLVDIGSAQITLGVCLLLYCVSSIFMLRYSRLVLHKLGHVNVMYLTMVAYSIRYLVLSFLTNAWLALPAEVLHGVTYSLFWAAASSTASIVAPPGTQATSQGLAGGIYWDLGRGVGIILSGQFLQVFGARWTFRAYSMVCVGVLPLLWMLDRIWQVPNSKTQNLKVDKEQEIDAVSELLKSNDLSLNNNENNPLEKTILPTVHDDLNSPERHLHESRFVGEESEVISADLGTVESQTCENTRSEL